MFIFTISSKRRYLPCSEELERGVCIVHNWISTLLKSIIGIFVMYVIHFIIVPIFFVVDTIGLVFFTSTVIIMIVAFLKLTDKLHIWLLSDIIYTILVFLYHPPGAYGIGMTILGFPSLGQVEPTYRRDGVWIEIIFIVASVVITQVLLWVCLKLFRLIVKKF